jgi:hypothetical protein
VRKTFLSKRAIVSLPFLSKVTINCRTAGPGESRSCRSLTLSNVPSEMTAEAPIFSLDSSLYLQTHVGLWFHKSSKVHKFVDDFEILVVITSFKNRLQSEQLVCCWFALTETLLGNAVLPRLRRVISSYAVLCKTLYQGLKTSFFFRFIPFRFWKILISFRFRFQKKYRFVSFRFLKNNVSFCFVSVK